MPRKPKKKVRRSVARRKAGSLASEKSREARLTELGEIFRKVCGVKSHHVAQALATQAVNLLLRNRSDSRSVADSLVLTTALTEVFLGDSEFAQNPLVIGRIPSGKDEDDVTQQHLVLDGVVERLDVRRVVDRVVLGDRVGLVPEASRSIEKIDEPLVGIAMRPGMTDEQTSKPQGRHCVSPCRAHGLRLWRDPLGAAATLRPR